MLSIFKQLVEREIAFAFTYKLLLATLNYSYGKNRYFQMFKQQRWHRCRTNYLVSLWEKYFVFKFVEKAFVHKKPLTGFAYGNQTFTTAWSTLCFLICSITYIYLLYDLWSIIFERANGEWWRNQLSKGEAK